MASPTLAELRAQSAHPVPLPKAVATVTMVQGQHLLTEVQALHEELADLRVEGVAADEEGNPTRPPLKAGEGGKAARDRNARIKAAGEEITAVEHKLADFQGVVELEGVEGGDWQRFKDAHPPREDSLVDLQLARFKCNATVVFENLGDYVKTWNGEALAEGEWDSSIAQLITYSDRRDLVTEVVLMHEQGMARVPKSLSGSSETESSATD